MHTRSQTVLRWIAIGCGALGTAFWAYTFHHIAHVPPGDGSGFQWLAAVPLSAIWFCLTLPALLLAWSRRLAVMAAGFGIAGLISFAIIWNQLLAEFAGSR